jgi:CRP-like cAMP-binding protein
MRSTRKKLGTRPASSLGLRECSRADVARLAAAARVVEVRRGHVVSRQGDAASRCSLVVEGAVELRVADRPTTNVGPGGWVGHVDVLDRSPYQATAVALTEVMLWELDASDLDRLLVEAPTFARAVVRELSHRLRSLEVRAHETGDRAVDFPLGRVVALPLGRASARGGGER